MIWKRKKEPTDRFSAIGAAGEASARARRRERSERRGESPKTRRARRRGGPIHRRPFGISIEAYCEEYNDDVYFG